MKKAINIASIFTKHLFWDMDQSKLHLEQDMDIIIPRAMFATVPDTFEAVDMQTKSALKVKQHFLGHFFDSKILL
jgi:hypothetical protein